MKVLVVGRTPCYVSLHPELLAILTSIRVVERVPLEIALKGTLNKFEGVVAEVLGNQSLSRADKYQELLLKTKSDVTIKKVMLDVLRNIRESNYEDENVTQAQLHDAIIELSKWVTSEATQSERNNKRNDDSRRRGSIMVSY